jgi:hypothetical protein
LVTIKGDRMNAEQFQQFLLATFAGYRRSIKPGGSLYVCHSSSWQREFQNNLEAAGFEARCQIIWAKNTFAWGFGRYKFQHEPIFYCHVAGQSDAWYGDKSQSTLWCENKPAANRVHPTAKPVELIRARAFQQQQSGRSDCRLFWGFGLNADRMRAARTELAADGDRPQVRRCHRPTLGAIHRKLALLDGSGRAFDEIAEERRKVAE